MTGAEALPPFAEDIFVSKGKGVQLLGSRCPQCGRAFFPRTGICPDDGTATDALRLDGEASLYSFTVVRTKPPFALPAPYPVGYVDLPKHDLRVFMLLDPDRIDALEIGMPMRLASGEMGVDLKGRRCIRPYFTPADTKG
jgi:uncharacterized OB-fold protein